MRQVHITRNTNEVKISGKLAIDGSGEARVSTGIEPLNHLLTLWAFHGFFDLELEARGDLQHHLIEDIGIALGKAFARALGEKEGIRRYGSFSLVMDEVVVEVNIDISGRPVLHGGVIAEQKEEIMRVLEQEKFDDTSFTFTHIQEFLHGFVQHAGLSVVYVVKSGPGDLHHLLEALCKAMGKALDEATQIDPRRKGVPSTKGIID
ncbi:MAG: imidazoleglycerol-phosphate dehydratase [Candidatus Omnitrophica bacterium]|nr:imidazoleglycerol-phosphate dehydratase [Candidatus Omnitrophota bacterium]